MKLEWCPDNASKAYIDTVKSCEIHQGSGVAELISAMAAGWNAQLIVETWSKGSRIPTSIGLAVAARHTGGRHVCIVPDNRSRVAYIEAISPTISSPETPQVIVGDPEEVMSELEDIDFLVADAGRRDFTRFLKLARLSTKGAVLVCKNASACKTCGFKWRGEVSGGRKVVRTAYLPVGNGVDMAHVAGTGTGSGSGSSSLANRRKWVKHFDKNSGEEYVVRTNC